MTTATKPRQGSRYVLASVAVVALVLLGYVLLGQRVVDILRQQETAQTDNVHWTLAQTEVEYLRFALSLHYALDEATPQTLDALRRDFDIFYSRVETVSTGRIYGLARETEGYDASIAALRGFLDAHVGDIDGDDAALTRALPAMTRDADALGPAIRQLANSGLVFFARRDDAQRSDFRATLGLLASVTAVMFGAIGLLAYYFNRLRLRTIRRGRELKQAHDRMSRILATSIDGVIVADPDGRVLEFNASAERIFGITRDQALGRTVGGLVVPHHLRDAHEAGMERVRHGGAYHIVGQGIVQIEAKRADGTVFPVEMSLERTLENDRLLYVSFIRDITNRVAAEKELTHARDRALAGEQAKADFLAIMSHEIRTPLNGLLGSLALLDETRLTAQQRGLVSNMQVSGELLMKHLNAVLDITKLEAGAITVNRQPVDVGALMKEIVDSQIGAASSKDCQLTCGWTGPAVPRIATDPAFLSHALLNLVGNAIKFTDHGRVSIEAEVVPPARNEDARELIEIRVSDTGPGIAAADLDRIFRDFETIDASFGRKVGGTGLGLGIARRLAKALGGTITVRSVVGEGSTFTLRMPLERAEAEQPATARAEPAISRAPLNILLVEDNAINREVATEMLRAARHRVTTAENGQLGVDAARETRFDVILMDISMPVLDGRAAARAIRADGACKDVPIIALSANAAPDAEASFLEAGMDGFVQKPMTRAQLLAAIDAARATLGGLAQVAPPAAARELIDPAARADMREGLGAEAFDTLHARMVTETDAFFDTADSLAPDALGRAAHKCAGSVAMFGLSGLHQALARLEDSCTSAGDTSDALREARDTWRRTQAALPGL